jgi:hypothetical protein
MVQANDLHRVFIQSLLSRRAMGEETAVELYRRAVAAVRGKCPVILGSLRLPLNIRIRRLPD